MINLNFLLTNPYSDRFEHVYGKDGKLTKNKSWEFQIYKSDTIVELEFRLAHRTDHAGVKLGIGLLGYTVSFQLYDIRHWNYDTKCWEVYNQ